MPTQTDSTLLQMALVGYEAERQKIQDKIAEIQRELNGQVRTRRTNTTAADDLPKKSRRGKMSAEARKRIAAAQKKRWAEYRKAKSVGA